MNSAHETELLASIDAGRLALICGAGLSMAPPSSTPNARQVAEECVTKFLPEKLPADVYGDLERTADFFLSSPPLWTRFRDQLVNWASFKRQPNAGHFAVADFLCCQAWRIAITTNFDVLIEAAAARIGEPDFQPACEDGQETRVYEHRNLLKVHGCMERCRDRVVWSHRQLEDGNARDDTIVTRMQAWRTWLGANLRGMDLVVIGFWSDWAYLNDVLEHVLNGTAPALFYLVDPADERILREKAPGLWTLAHSHGVTFRHVPQSGAEFLDELRVAFSTRFFGRLLYEARPTFVAMGGDQNLEARLPGKNANQLYELRRDACGVAPGEIVRFRRPENHMRITGAVHLLLQARGLDLEGSRYFGPNGETIRVVNGAGRVMSIVRAEFSKSQPQTVRQEFVICDAIDDGGAAADVVREGSEPTIVRAGSGAEWLTVDAARTRGLC